MRLSWLLSGITGKAVSAEELRGGPLRYLKPAEPEVPRWPSSVLRDALTTAKVL